MAIVTTFVCDISGISGTSRDDFVTIKISSGAAGGGYLREQKTIERLVHMTVAKRMHLVNPSSAKEVLPEEPTFESKLKTLLQDWVGDLVTDELANRN